MATINTEWGNRQDLLAYIGESFQVDFVVKDKNATPVPLNIALAINIQFRKYRDQVLPDFSLSLTDGIVIAGTNNEIIRTNKILSVPKAGNYHYDVEVVYDSTFTFYPYNNGIVTCEMRTSK